MNRYSDMTIWQLREELKVLQAELASRDLTPRAQEGTVRVPVEPAMVLEPFPKGEREAIQSAISFIDEYFRARPCDSEAVTDCVRCNAQYLARAMKQLLAAAPSNREGDERE